MPIDLNNQILEVWLVAGGILAFGAAVGTFVGYYFRLGDGIKAILRDDD